MNGLPKQTAPAASQTARDTRTVFDFMAQMKTGIRLGVNLFLSRPSKTMTANVTALQLGSIFHIGTTEAHVIALKLKKPAK